MTIVTKPELTADPSTTPQDPQTPLSPTETYYEKLVKDFVTAFEQLTADLPQVETTHVMTKNFVRSHVNVSNDFLAAAIAAVEQIPALQGTQKFDIVRARDTFQFLQAFTPLCDRITAFRDALEFTIRSKKASLAADALQIYDISKGLARDPGASVGAVNVSSHVVVLKRTLGRVGPKHKKTNPQPPASSTGAAATEGPSHATNVAQAA